MNKPLALLAVLLLAGCASERVVLLPSADGRPSGVVVRDAGGEQVLDQPYAATVRRLGSHRGYQSDAAEVEARYGQTLRAMPQRPVSYTLYFELGGDKLTAASAAEFANIKRDIAARAAAEIMVIGHTDRVGAAAANDALSAKRAQAVREQLAGEGVPVEKMEVAGRGEREPLVPTADEVDEPRNRRVEISIR